MEMNARSQYRSEKKVNGLGSFSSRAEGAALPPTPYPTGTPITRDAA